MAAPHTPAAEDQRHSSKEFNSRPRTGLVSTWVTPCRNASSSHSAWLAAVQAMTGSWGIAAAEPFDDPDAIGAHQVNVENARGGETVREQRFSLLNLQAVDDTILLRIQSGANRFREIRMSGRNQNGFHRLLTKPNVAQGPSLSPNHSTAFARRSIET